MAEEPQLVLVRRNAAGYRHSVPVRATHRITAAEYGYVAAAISFGLFAGLALAVSSGRAAAAASTPPPALLRSAQSSQPALSAPPQFAPARRRQGRPMVEGRTRPGVSRVTSGSFARTRRALRKVQPALHRIDWQRAPRGNKAPRKPYVSTGRKADQEPTAQAAASEVAAGPVILGIQGDVTVANFDEASRTIETYEGETYILAQTSLDNNSIQWQNYPFNLHYRCDGSGNCTLSHGGGSAIARLAR